MGRAVSQEKEEIKQRFGSVELSSVAVKVCGSEMTLLLLMLFLGSCCACDGVIKLRDSI